MKKALVVLGTVALVSTGLFARPASAAGVIGGGNAGDTIVGSVGNDIIFGKGGSDTINGRAGEDRIFGGGGHDVMDGAGGDDTIIDDDGRAGDVLRGRDGSDTLYSLDGANDKLRCGPGGGIAFADRGDDVVGCSPVIRRSRDFQGARVRAGTNSGDFFDKASREVIVFGRRGNDILRGSDDVDFIFGGAGADIMQAYDDDDVIIDDDTNPNDTVQTGEDADVTYMADGAQGSVDCDPKDNDGGADDIVYVDPEDSVFHCGHVIRVAAF